MPRVGTKPRIVDLRREASLITNKPVFYRKGPPQGIAPLLIASIKIPENLCFST